MILTRSLAASVKMCLLAGRTTIVLVGGRGSDFLYGDGLSTGDGVPLPITPDGTGLFLVKNLDAIDIAVEFLEASAGFDSSYGYYFADGQGSPISGGILSANVKEKRTAFEKHSAFE